MYTDTEAEDEYTFPVDFEYDSTIQHTPPLPLSRLASPSKTALKAQPPRPPNAWILYRSDRLKDISAGRVVKGLDAVMRDSGFSGSSASSGEESASGMGMTTKGTTPATSVSGGTDDEKPKLVVKRKGKKGAKEPTEGLLRMGTGKTGRGLPQAHISKMISELWKRESPDIRKEYELRSEKKKNEASLFPVSDMMVTDQSSMLFYIPATSSLPSRRQTSFGQRRSVIGRSKLRNGKRSQKPQRAVCRQDLPSGGT
jgi:hypothetical protein